MSLQDLVGHVWSYSWGGDHAPGDHPSPEGDRGTSLWRFHRETGSTAGRHPRLPSARLRASRTCDMPRRHFIAVACCWAAAVAVLLAVVLAVRWLG